MNKKLFISVIVIAVMITGLRLVFINNANEGAKPPHIVELEAIDEGDSKKQLLSPIKDPELIAELDLKDINSTETEEGSVDLSSEAPWALDERMQLPRHPESFQNTEYQTVTFDPEMETKVGIGDQISLPITPDRQVDVVVTEEDVNSNGDYVWGGTIIDGGNSYPVVVTQGEHGTYGLIATENDTYTITTVDGQGVIYKNPPLPETHEDDFLIPEVHVVTFQ